MSFKLNGLLVLFLCLTLAVLAQCTPSISHISETQICDVGSKVDFDCTVHDAQDSPVLWVKHDNKTNESMILSVSSFLVVRDARLSVRFNATSATYTLSIKDVQEVDACWYKCIVNVSESNQITAEVELQVRLPPIVGDNSTRSHEGDNNVTAAW